MVEDEALIGCNFSPFRPSSSSIHRAHIRRIRGTKGPPQRAGILELGPEGLQHTCGTESNPKSIKHASSNGLRGCRQARDKFLVVAAISD